MGNSVSAPAAYVGEAVDDYLLRITDGKCSDLDKFIEYQVRQDSDGQRMPENVRDNKCKEIYAQVAKRLVSINGRLTFGKVKKAREDTPRPPREFPEDPTLGWTHEREDTPRPPREFPEDPTLGWTNEREDTPRPPRTFSQEFSQDPIVDWTHEEKPSSHVHTVDRVIERNDVHAAVGQNEYQVSEDDTAGKSNNQAQNVNPVTKVDADSDIELGGNEARGGDTSLDNKKQDQGDINSEASGVRECGSGHENIYSNSNEYIVVTNDRLDTFVDENRWALDIIDTDSEVNVDVVECWPNGSAPDEGLDEKRIGKAANDTEREQNASEEHSDNDVDDGDVIRGYSRASVRGTPVLRSVTRILNHPPLEDTTGDCERAAEMTIDNGEDQCVTPDSDDDRLEQVTSAALYGSVDHFKMVKRENEIMKTKLAKLVSYTKQRAELAASHIGEDLNAGDADKSGVEYELECRLISEGLNFCISPNRRNEFGAYSLCDLSDPIDDAENQKDVVTRSTTANNSENPEVQTKQIEVQNTVVSGQSQRETIDVPCNSQFESSKHGADTNSPQQEDSQPQATRPVEYGSVEYLRQAKLYNADITKRIQEAQTKLDTWHNPEDTDKALQRQNEYQQEHGPPKYGTRAHYQLAQHETAALRKTLNQITSKIDSWQSKTVLDAIAIAEPRYDVNKPAVAVIPETRYDAYKPVRNQAHFGNQQQDANATADWLSGNRNPCRTNDLLLTARSPTGALPVYSKYAHGNRGTASTTTGNKCAQEHSPVRAGEPGSIASTGNRVTSTSARSQTRPCAQGQVSSRNAPETVQLPAQLRHGGTSSAGTSGNRSVAASNQAVRNCGQGIIAPACGARIIAGYGKVVPVQRSPKAAIAPAACAESSALPPEASEPLVQQTNVTSVHNYGKKSTVVLTKAGLDAMRSQQRENRTGPLQISHEF